MMIGLAFRIYLLSIKQLVVHDMNEKYRFHSVEELHGGDRHSGHMRKKDAGLKAGLRFFLFFHYPN